MKWHSNTSWIPQYSVEFTALYFLLKSPPNPFFWLTHIRWPLKRKWIWWMRNLMAPPSVSPLTHSTALLTQPHVQWWMRNLIVPPPVSSLTTALHFSLSLMCSDEWETVHDSVHSPTPASLRSDPALHLSMNTHTLHCAIMFSLPWF